MKRVKLPFRLIGYALLYLLAVAAGLTLIHEVTHVLAAMILGVPFTEIKLGFYGINPSVTLPEWFSGISRTIVWYAGGLVSGAVALGVYLGYWVRRYRHTHSLIVWSLGLVTIILAAWEFSSGYLEGRYHASYVTGASSLISPTSLFATVFMLFAMFLHFWLNSRRKIKPSTSQQ